MGVNIMIVCSTPLPPPPPQPPPPPPAQPPPPLPAVAVSSQRVSGVCCLWTLLHTYLGHRVTVNWAIELQPCHVLLFSVDLRSDHSWMLFAHISIKTLVVRSICLFNREMFRHSYRENMYILVDRSNIDSINSIQNIHRIRYIHNELLCNCHR